MVRKITNKNGNWVIYGINLIPSDSIYIKLKKAIESNNLSEEYLQKITGHLLPIHVNFSERSITFCNY